VAVNEFTCLNDRDQHHRIVTYIYERASGHAAGHKTADTWMAVNVELVHFGLRSGLIARVYEHEREAISDLPPSWGVIRKSGYRFSQIMELEPDDDSKKRHHALAMSALGRGQRRLIRNLVGAPASNRMSVGTRFKRWPRRAMTHRFGVAAARAERASLRRI
jgi:hypothetical protein